MTVDVEAYLKKFRAFGEAPSLELYMRLFHPDATLFDAGMERPLTVDEIPSNIAPILAALPDFSFEIRHWRLRDDTLFAEAANSASVGGEPLAWESVYCMTLLGDQVIRGRRYYDRDPLLRRLQPDLPALPRHEPVEQDVADPVPRSTEEFVEALTALWQRPDPPRFADFYAHDGVILEPNLGRPLTRREIPGYFRFVLRPAPDFTCERIAWAGDDERLLVEWLGRGTANGKAYTLPIMERYRLKDGLAIEGTPFFDSITLAQALAG